MIWLLMILRTLLHPRGPSSSSLEISSCPAMRATSSGVFRSSHQGTAVCWDDAPRICSRCASRTAMLHKSTSRPQTYLQYVLSSSTIFQRLWMHTDQRYPCSAAKGWRAHCIVWRTRPWPQPMQDQLNYYTRSKVAVRGNNPKCVNFIEFHWISYYCAVTESCSWDRHAVPQSALHYTLPDYTALICHDNSIHDHDLVWCYNHLIYLSFRCLYVLDVW